MTEQYARGMTSLSEFCVEKNGTVVTDEKRKKKMLEESEAEKGAGWGEEKCASMVSFCNVDAAMFWTCTDLFSVNWCVLMTN